MPDSIFVLLLIFIIVLTSAFIIIYTIYKRRPLASFHSITKDRLRLSLMELLEKEGCKVIEGKNKIHVEKGIFKAIDLFIEEDFEGTNLLYRTSGTLTVWILVIIGILFFGIFALIIAIISEIESRNFAKGDVINILRKSEIWNYSKGF